jgi:acyl transferase domain-containing protein
LFVTEYALAQLWMSWGVQPVAMIGHSIGEYVAACLAGVFRLEDALALVARRGRLMQELPPGAMLAVPLPVREVEGLLEPGVAVAAVNEDAATVVSGPAEAVARLEGRLATQGAAVQRLHTSHAFHSEMMDPILAPFTESVRGVARQAPRIPYVSNLTGSWVTAAEATDPRYWGRHLREPVRFAQGLRELMKEPERVLLEVGPGRTLSGLAGRQAGRGARTVVLSSLRHPSEPPSDVAFVLGALGRLWQAGVEVDWRGFHARGPRRRMPLPTYPFERQRYWVGPRVKGQPGGSRRGRSGKRPEISDWFYLPSWKRSAAPSLDDGPSKCGPWLVFADASGLGERLSRLLTERGEDVVTVRAAKEFAEPSAGAYSLNPAEPGNYTRLLEALDAQGRSPTRIAHLWGLESEAAGARAGDAARRVQERGFFSLVYLARALGARDVRREIVVVTSGVQDVTGEEALRPEQATVLGPCKVIPQEYSALSCRTVDLVAPDSGGWDEESVGQVLAELTSPGNGRVVAYRRGRRWVQGYEPWPLSAGKGRPRRLREGGVYLVTGGLGGVGLEVAESLARQARARLVLVARTALPAAAAGERPPGAPDDGDEPSQRLRRLRTIEALGAEVLVVQADVTDLEQMRKVVSEAESRFGALHGVIHAAGAERSFQSLAETGPGEAEAQFRPRLEGAAVLEQALEGRSVDFCLLISSLSAVLGGLGAAAYTAAHVFLDAFAARHNRRSRVPWLSVNWDRWFTWREALSPADADEAGYFMTPEEAREALRRVLSHGTPGHLVVSTGDLEARIDRWIRLVAPEPSEDSGAARSSRYARPELSGAYVEPRSSEEKTLTGIWCEVLGLEKVGVDDDFFELGGDSVLGLRIVAKANEAGLRLTGRQIFEHHTIAGLARALAGSTPLPVAPVRALPPPGPVVAEAPSAFPGARLDREDLEAFLAELGRGGGTQPK